MSVIIEKFEVKRLYSSTARSADRALGHATCGPSKPSTKPHRLRRRQTPKRSCARLTRSRAETHPPHKATRAGHHPSPWTRSRSCSLRRAAGRSVVALTARHGRSSSRRSRLTRCGPRGGRAHEWESSRKDGAATAARAVGGQSRPQHTPAARIARRNFRMWRRPRCSGANEASAPSIGSTSAPSNPAPATPRASDISSPLSLSLSDEMLDR